MVKAPVLPVPFLALYSDENLLQIKFAKAPSKNISSHQSNGNTLLLDGRWIFPALLENAHKKFTLQIIVLEAVSFGRSDILPCRQNKASRKLASILWFLNGCLWAGLAIGSSNLHHDSALHAFAAFVEEASVVDDAASGVDA